ncbi:MAG: phage holin family protein [Acidobacteria bacterium]|nr:phage holin family protein [Acidobacteriota bacterium]
MTRFLVHWAVVAIGLAVAARVVPGVHVESTGALLVGALVLGFVNAVVRPVLLVLTLPITVVTLGLFYFVVNGLAFMLAAAVTRGFTVASIWSAIGGAIVISLISWFIAQFAARE